MMNESAKLQQKVFSLWTKPGKIKLVQFGKRPYVHKEKYQDVLN